jgi:aquaglyceroporin related protein, other eukaryote
MSHSGDTAVVHDTEPRRMDWADAGHDNKGQYGSGPGLQNPDSSIQNSDAAEADHLEKVANAVGPGPGQRTPSGPRVGHFEHAEHAHSPTRSPPPQNYHLDNTPSISTKKSRKSQSEIDHHNTLSSIRTRIGLEREAPIVDDHDSHEHLTWSSVRTIFREPFAEFFGTFIMVLFGNGSVAQVLLSGGQKSAPGKNGFGEYQSISWG